VPFSTWLAWAILAFGIVNICITLLRGFKPEWLAAAWLIAYFAWFLLTLWSLRAAYLLLLLLLPFFGARPGDLVTNAQDTIVLVTAALSLWRFPLHWGHRPVLWPGWLLALVGLASLIAHANLCFYPLWPIHQDNLTRNLFFMFSQDWDWTIGLSEWWMLVLWLLLARGAWHMIRQKLLRPDGVAAAITLGLLLALLVGYLDYFSPAFHARMEACQLRVYDTIENVAPHWPMPDSLRSPAGDNITFKAFHLNRSWFGLYLLTALPVALAFLASRQQRWAFWLWRPVALAGLLAALLVGSRACLYSICTSLIVLGLVIAATRLPLREVLAQPRWAWLCILLVACTLLIPWFLSVTPSDSGWLHTSGRNVTWGKAVTLLKNRPYLGVGYESFGLAARDLAPDVQEPPITAHNFFLQVLTCTGPLGLLALLLLFHRPTLVLLRYVDSPVGPPSPSFLPAGFAFVFVMVVLAGQVQHWFYSHSNAILFWLALAVLAAKPDPPHPLPATALTEPPPSARS
jgi:hypothetical protein